MSLRSLRSSMASISSISSISNAREGKGRNCLRDSLPWGDRTGSEELLARDWNSSVACGCRLQCNYKIEPLYARSSSVVNAGPHRIIESSTSHKSSSTNSPQRNIPHPVCLISDPDSNRLCPCPHLFVLSSLVLSCLVLSCVVTVVLIPNSSLSHLIKLSTLPLPASILPYRTQPTHHDPFFLKPGSPRNLLRHPVLSSPASPCDQFLNSWRTPSSRDENGQNLRPQEHITGFSISIKPTTDLGLSFNQ